MSDLALTDIKQLLQAWLASDNSAQFFPNPGNAGDCLIASANWQLFDAVGLRPETAKPRDFKAGGNVILGGGGNLIPQYHDTEKALKRCLEIGVNKCLLLPSTIRGNEALLARLDSRFTIVCRDYQSFSHVQAHVDGASVFLSPDIVFSLEPEKLNLRVKTLAHRWSLMFDQDWFNRRFKWRRALRYQRRNLGQPLQILRCDIESAAGGANKLGDLNGHFITKRMGRASCDQVSSDIIRLLSDADAVVTDRLHIAIPSLLLNRSLTIRDNNYGKLSAVLALVESNYSNYRFID